MTDDDDLFNWDYPVAAARASRLEFRLLRGLSVAMGLFALLGTVYALGAA